MIRSLQREQRERTRPVFAKVDAAGVGHLNQHKAKSNYTKLIREQLERQGKLDEYVLAPPSGLSPGNRKLIITKKLNKYAKRVLEMDKKLGIDPA